MVHDAVTALVALLVSILPIMLVLTGLDWLLRLVGLETYYYPLVGPLYAAPCLAIWTGIALLFARLTGSLPRALFRTALAAFPVTLVWAFVNHVRHPTVLWGVAAAPLITALLAHAMRLVLAPTDADGKPLVTKDERGRAAAAHAMAALGALWVLATLWTVTAHLRNLRYHHKPAEAELWVWISIAVIGIAVRITYALLARAPGSDPRDPDPEPVECIGGALTLGLLGIAGIGWIFVAVGMAHTIGPEILAGVLQLTMLLLGVLAWLQLQTLLERWRTRYGGKLQIDAFGCALSVIAGLLLLCAAMLLTVIGATGIAFWFIVAALFVIAVGAALSSYFLPRGEGEPLARVVVLALGCLLTATILARWRLPDSMLTADRERYLMWLTWILGLLVVAIIAGILERRGVFDEFSAEQRATRNSRIHDGEPGDTMRRD